MKIYLYKKLTFPNVHCGDHDLLHGHFRWNARSARLISAETHKISDSLPTPTDVRNLSHPPPTGQQWFAPSPPPRRVRRRARHRQRGTKSSDSETRPLTCIIINQWKGSDFMLYLIHCIIWLNTSQILWHYIYLIVQAEIAKQKLELPTVLVQK